MQTPPVLPTTTADAAIANSKLKYVLPVHPRVQATDRSHSDNESGTVVSDSHSQLNAKEALEEIEVKFEEGDPANPLNWKRAYRWYITLLAGLLGINAYVTSSCTSLFLC